MAQDRRKTVHAVFRDRYDAEQVFNFLHDKGFADSEINVLMSDKTRATYYPPTSKEGHHHAAGTMVTEGLGVGGAIGTAVGATLGAIAAIGTSLAIPGLGLIIAGPIVAALAGGGAGAVAGGAIGALVGAGMTQENAEAYAEALRNGGVVVGVAPRSDDQANEIERKFKEFNGENVCYC